MRQSGVEPIEHRLAEARWTFGRLDIELGANRIAFAAQRIDQRFQFRQTRRIGAEERILVDARPVATAAINRADLFDATAIPGAELLEQIILRDRPEQHTSKPQSL